MFVDSHCHLSFPELYSQVDSIRAAMATAQVDRALVICTTLEEFPRVHGLALDHENFWCTAGVHPDNESVSEPDTATLVELARRPKVVAIGETGLDYYRLAGRSLDDMHWQRERFRVHIRAARAVRLPLVVHTRSASSDTLAILREEGAAVGIGGPGGVFHCFTETLEFARSALDMGFFVSFSGIVTFRNANELRDVVRFVPLDRCLIETDSPYLAPVPYRGKTNNPSLVPWVARQVAESKALPLEFVARATTHNFERLFGVPSRQEQSI